MRTLDPNNMVRKSRPSSALQRSSAQLVVPSLDGVGVSRGSQKEKSLTSLTLTRSSQKFSKNLQGDLEKMKESGCEQEREVVMEKPVDDQGEGDLEGEVVGQKQKEGEGDEDYGAWSKHKREKHGGDKLLGLIKE